MRSHVVRSRSVYEVNPVCPPTILTTLFLGTPPCEREKTELKLHHLKLFLGSLDVSPKSGNMLGGENILISGPGYKPSQRIVCEFPGGQLSNGSYVSDMQASCTVPMLNVTGRLSIKLSLNGGKTFDFQGTFTSGNYCIDFHYLLCTILSL